MKKRIVELVIFSLFISSQFANNHPQSLNALNALDDIVYCGHSKQKARSLKEVEKNEPTRSSYEDDYFQFDENGYPVNTPVYGNDKLLDWVKPGDILYDGHGSFAGVGYTGHIGIVETIVGSGSNRYIRTIEAVPNFGVARALLDSTRFASAKMILRVGTASTSQKTAAINFCINQLGKSYGLHSGPNTSTNSEEWYCSELVWAAYYNQGISIGVGSTPW